MFERFTRPAREVVVLAQEQAAGLRHGFIGTEHLLLALAEDDGVAGEALRATGVTAADLRAGVERLVGRPDALDAAALGSLGIDLDDVRRSVEESFGPGALDELPHRPRRWGRRLTPGPGHRPFSGRAKKSLELALREAVRLDHHHIGTEHLLLGVLREGSGVGVRVLTDRGVDLAVLRADVVQRTRRTA